MHNSSDVSLEMTLAWSDGEVHHVDRQYFAKANLWRDIFPPQMGEPFHEPKAGDTASCIIPAGELLEPYDASLIRTIKNSQFNRRPRKYLSIEPHRGRYYPRNFLRNVPGVNDDDRRPMRILDIDEESIRIDLNPPMATYTVEATARIDEILPPQAEHGGCCNNFVYEMIQAGVGMQAVLHDAEVDFLSGDALARLDEADDGVFYNKARLVQHLDATCRQHIRTLYHAHLQPGMQVLDLMSSWVSHFDRKDGIEVTGLGLNEEELSNNDTLDSYVVHDLNRQPELPFADQTFDLVLCTASVEYLVKPHEVFDDIARCLKPGGRCIVSFSDRWFPPKAIMLWSTLHPFERLGLVTSYFRAGGGFTDIETLSIRHYPRPADDKYADEQPYSDPVFAVSARKP